MSSPASPLTGGRQVAAEDLAGALSAHARPAEAAIETLASSRHGLHHREAQARLAHDGPNTLPGGKPPTPAAIFFIQFKSPLIYVLLLAALAARKPM